MVASAEPAEESSWLGLQVDDANDREVRRQFDLERGQKGVVVVEVSPGSAADEAGFRAGDIITEVNGEKIYVTDGARSDTLVVWATLDKSLGKAAIKSFIVEKGTPGCEVTRLEHKMGIRASDTAAGMPTV